MSFGRTAEEVNEIEQERDKLKESVEELLQALNALYTWRRYLDSDEWKRAENVAGVRLQQHNVLGRIDSRTQKEWLDKEGIKRCNETQTLESALWASMFERPADEIKYLLKNYIALYDANSCKIPETSIKCLLRDYGLLNPIL